MFWAAVDHIEWMMRFYKKQVDGGRWFLHEHPLTATSWKLPCVMKMMAESGVRCVVGDQ